MADYTKYTKQEMQAYAIAKSIKENQIVIVGTGLPLIGASLAKRAVCPSCHPIVESGLMDCSPVEVPRSVGDNRFMAHCAVQWPNVRFVGFEANEWLHDEDRLIAFIGGALQILATLPPVEQDLYVSRLSEELGVERQNMKVQLQDLVARQGNRREKREFNRIVQENMRKTARETMATDASLRKLRAEDRLISLLLRYPDCSRLCKDFDPQWLTPGFAQRVFTLILQRLENGDGTELMYLRDREY